MYHTCELTLFPMSEVFFIIEVGTGRNGAEKWNMEVLRLLKIMWSHFRGFFPFLY